MKLLLCALALATAGAAKVDITHLFGEDGTATFNGRRFKCCVSTAKGTLLADISEHSDPIPGCGQLLGDTYHDARGGKCEIEDDHMPEGFCGSSGGSDSVASRA